MTEFGEASLTGDSTAQSRKWTYASIPHPLPLRLLEVVGVRVAYRRSSPFPDARKSPTQPLAVGGFTSCGLGSGTFGPSWESHSRPLSAGGTVDWIMAVHSTVPVFGYSLLS